VRVREELAAQHAYGDTYIKARDIAYEAHVALVNAINVVQTAREARADVVEAHSRMLRLGLDVETLPEPIPAADGLMQLAARLPYEIRQELRDMEASHRELATADSNS
jgi:hypothetical protein